MLSESERQAVFKYAVVPEQLPDYVQSVSFGEPFLHDGYLCYYTAGILIFIGYPLVPPSDYQHTVELRNAVQTAIRRFRPTTINLVTPMHPEFDGLEPKEEDDYFRIRLPLNDIPSDVNYMVRRARRDLTINEARFGPEHDLLVQNFINERDFNSDHKDILSKLSVYLKLSRSAKLMEARARGKLSAFTIIDLGSSDYGFYLFNIRSRAVHIPGTSDLLLYESAHLAAESGKRFLNLGLGINPGIRKFKEKWGASAFLPYSWSILKPKHQGFLCNLQRIFSAV